MLIVITIKQEIIQHSNWNSPTVFVCQQNSPDFILNIMHQIDLLILSRMLITCCPLPENNIEKLWHVNSYWVCDKHLCYGRSHRIQWEKMLKVNANLGQCKGTFILELWRWSMYWNVVMIERLNLTSYMNFYFLYEVCRKFLLIVWLCLQYVQRVTAMLYASMMPQTRINYKWLSVGWINLNIWRGAWKKALGDFWADIEFSLFIEGSKKQFARRSLQSIWCHLGSFSTHPFIYFFSHLFKLS